MSRQAQFLDSFGNSWILPGRMQPVKPLQPPECHALSATLGWLGLGNVEEAEAELNTLPARFHRHPDVLEAQWQIHAQRAQWESALETAHLLLKADPGRPSGWLHRAYALRRVPSGTLEQAMEALLPAAERFPDEPTIPYNLSCYACQMRDLNAARFWLKRAEKTAGGRQVKAMALADPDLSPLWNELRGGEHPGPEPA